MSAFVAWRPVVILVGIYLVACQLGHTLLYTVVAYLVSAADKTGQDFGDTVNEISGQYVLLTFALTALLLTVTIWLADKALYRQDPFWNSAHKSAWQLDRGTKQELSRGLASGASAGLVYLLILTLARQLTFLGIYLTSTMGTPIFPLFFVDLAALVAFLFCEEFLFRHKILKRLAAHHSPLPAAIYTTALYLGVKYTQFQLSPLDLVNLGLFSLALCFFYLRSARAHRGLGFALALVGILHSFAGLPIWDVESPSFFLFKPLSGASEWLGGMKGAPFTGLGLTTILLMILIGSYLTWKQELEARQQYERIAQA